MINKTIINPQVSYLPGDTVTYQITVYNSGTYFSGSDVEIADTLPTGFTLQGCTYDSGDRYL